MSIALSVSTCRFLVALQCISQFSWAQTSSNSCAQPAHPRQSLIQQKAVVEDIGKTDVTDLQAYSDEHQVQAVTSQHPCEEFSCPYGSFLIAEAELPHVVCKPSGCDVSDCCEQQRVTIFMLSPPTCDDYTCPGMYRKKSAEELESVICSYSGCNTMLCCVYNFEPPHVVIHEQKHEVQTLDPLDVNIGEGGEPSFQAQDHVLEEPVGLEMNGGVFRPLFRKGTLLPAMKRWFLTSAADNQTSMSFRLFQGDSSQATENRAVGHLKITGLPQEAKLALRIRLFIKVTVDGTLTFSAEEASSDTVHALTKPQAIHFVENGTAPPLVYEYPVIRLAGNEHYNNENWLSIDAPFREMPPGMTSLGGRAVNGEMYARSEWQKTLRCKTNSPGSCEECAGPNGCWFGEEPCRSSGDLDLPACNRRAVRVGHGSEWTRFVNIIHVHCTTEAMELRVTARRVAHGSLRLYWDGTELQSGASIEMEKGSAESPIINAGTRNDFGVELTAKLSADVPGGHELTLEFVLDEESAPEAFHEALIEALELWMPKDFVVCEDSKACLEVLAKNSTLRNSNTQQLECLNAANPSGLCKEWRDCLMESTHRDRLLKMLEAAGVGESSPQPQAPSRGDSDSGLCMNPTLEDPESWDCDCYETALAGCEAIKQKPGIAESYSEPLCLRASFCNYPGVCNWWKDEWCQNTGALQTALSNLQEASLLKIDAVTQQGDQIENTSVQQLAQRQRLPSKKQGRLGSSHSTLDVEHSLDRSVSMKACR